MLLFVSADQTARASHNQQPLLPPPSLPPEMMLKSVGAVMVTAAFLLCAGGGAAAQTLDTAQTVDIGNQLEGLDVPEGLKQFLGAMVTEMRGLKAELRNKTLVEEELRGEISWLEKDRDAFHNKTRAVEAEFRRENTLLQNKTQTCIHAVSELKGDMVSMHVQLEECKDGTATFADYIQDTAGRKAYNARRGLQGGDSAPVSTDNSEIVKQFKRTVTYSASGLGYVEPSSGSGHRILTEEGCSGEEISRQIDAINVECCDEPTEDCSGGKVNTCNAGCGAMIMPFWTACQAQLTRDISKMLRDAVALCPPPDIPVNSMDTQMFMVTCPAGLPADDCIPLCEAEVHGYLLLLNIDGTDTTLTCSLSNLLYSWVGAAALGGFLGQNVAAFVSAVISGATGTYVLTLTEDANVGTNLVVQPGQNVIISGDAGLAEAPRWGTGGFTVGEMGSLALAYVRLARALSVVGGGSLALSRCNGDIHFSTIVVTSGGSLSLTHVWLTSQTLSTAIRGLSEAGSRLSLEAVVVVEHPEWGTMSGVVTRTEEQTQSPMCITTDNYIGSPNWDWYTDTECFVHYDPPNLGSGRTWEDHAAECCSTSHCYGCSCGSGNDCHCNSCPNDMNCCTCTSPTEAANNCDCDMLC
eukprot:SAG22_NODE_502_length_9704_cov_23.436439_5_plen_637_part_00